MGIGIAAVAVGLACRRADEALLFVVTHGVGGYPDGLGHLADVHGGVSRSDHAVSA